MATSKKPDYWLKAQRHLSKADPVLGKIIKAYKGETLASRGSAFFSLARAIVGQQISVKAADSIWKKLEAFLASPPPVGGRPGGGREGQDRAKGSPHPNPPPQAGEVAFLPSAILEADVAALRACGLSGQKVIYLKELSQFFATRARHSWHRKSDEQVITDLIAIKGIGKWSAEMFLIFHLMRPDIFPIADLGVRKAIEKHYNKSEKMTPKAMVALAGKWQPYRTVASWYLWRSLDPVPVEY